MKRKPAQQIVIVIFGILLNLIGKYIAVKLNLPIWLDVMGTCVAAYFAGPVGGMIAGASNNIIYGIITPASSSVFYMLVSIVVGIIFAYCAKKKYLETFSTVMITSFVIGVFSIVFSTPLNLIFYDGKSGNMWGDALFDMMDWYGMPHGLCAVMAEIVVEIIDKQISVLLAVLIIRGILKIGKKQSGKKLKQTVSAIILFALLFGNNAFNLQTKAASDSENDDLFDSYVETIYDSTTGMAASEANDIEETPDGYIWIGSYAGLTRYDGREFEFIREGGISSVTTMMTDSRGRLWVGTNDSGIACYENGSFTFYAVEDGLPVNSIRSFAERGDGTIYVGTTDKICKIDAEGIIRDVGADNITYVNSMTFHENRLVGVTNNGDLFMLDENDETAIFGESTDEFYYTCITSVEQGLMAGTSENFIISVDISGGDIKVHNKQNTGDLTRVTDIEADTYGRLWVCGENGLGFINSQGQVYIKHYTGFDSSIECMHQDYEGNLWFASSRCGVLKLSPNRFTNLFSVADVNNAVVNAVVLYDGSYYCGTDAGLVIIDEANHRVHKNELTDILEGDRVRSLYVDSKNRLWVCTYGSDGLLRYDNGKITIFNVAEKGTICDRFRCIVELESGIMAAGTSKGINFIQDDNIIGSITEEDGLANPQILCLVEGDDGTLYAGSDGAGIYAIRDRKIRENYTTHDGLTSDVILRMTVYKDGFVVVASNSLCYMSNGKIKALEHFPYFNNYDVRILGENAYVLSSSGIYMTDAEGLVSGKNFSYKLFNSSDGLLGGLTANSWNYIDENGVLYFCCNNGVLNFTPEEKAQRADYKFGIAYITGDGESIVPEGNTYVVPAEAKLIMIKASLRNYSLNNVKLKFYIEGLDDNPKVVSQSELESIQISNLPHGNYKIHIQIMSDDENTVVQEQVYTLVKEPQLWENWWYRVYLVIVVIWIVAFITWGILILINMSKRKKQLEELRKELEETVSIQTEEIRQQAERRVNFQWHVIDSMASLIESRDGNTGEHVINTRNYVALLSNELLKRGMYPDIITEEYVDALARVAPLHDVGKIKISDVILNKPGKFTPEEFEVMKEHTLFGDNVIGDILVDAEPEMLKVAKEVALCHHERWDGTGYPMGKKGEEIPLSARIMAIADVFDALVSKRVYKEAFEIEQAFDIIKESAGTHLDAGLVDVFLSIKDKVIEAHKVIVSKSK